jgi:hypothetical protein
VIGGRSAYMIRALLAAAARTSLVAYERVVQPEPVAARARVHGTASV